MSALTVGVITLACALVCAIKSRLPTDAYRIASGLVLAAMLMSIAWDPIGEEFGNSLGSRVMTLPPNEAFDTYLAADDPNGPSGFLQEQLAKDGPFRFFGYGPSILASTGGRANRTYHGRFRDDLVVNLLFARSTRMKLFNVQGYNPIQNERYMRFLVAVNGKPQNYHDSNILSGGVDSPLLRLLHVRYIIVQRQQAQEFKEIGKLEDEYPVVFENEVVKVLELPEELPHAWIIHDAVAATRQEAIALIQEGDFDLGTQAVIEGPLPKLKTTKNPDLERVEIVRYGEDSIELTAKLRTPGLVVVSEIYARGWQVLVDGKPATIYPTDFVLRGVAVPAGTHSIEFRYAPPAIARGIGITLATISLLATLIVQPWRFRIWIRRRPSFPRLRRNPHDFIAPGLITSTARSVQLKRSENSSKVVCDQSHAGK